jgi:hypothetical protein
MNNRDIIVWNGTTKITTINSAHAGPISGLRSLNDGRLASVSNDGNISKNKKSKNLLSNQPIYDFHFVLLLFSC